MSKIDDKYTQLKASGFDLGKPTSAEQSAGYGGAFRSYEHGNIYWHPVMGTSAHEVHGGILTLYLAQGGPGVNPKTGVRQFGFPLTDESRNVGQGVPFSQFETGAIYWTPGTGGVTLYGDVFRGYLQHQNELGLPVSSLATIWIGSGVYCERGVVWTCPQLAGSVFAGTFQPPLMGQPVIAPTAATNFALGDLAHWNTAGNNLTQKLLTVPPEALAMIWKDRLFLRPVGGGKEVPLTPGEVNLNSMTALNTAVPIPMSIGGALQDSTLYDLVLHPPTGNVYSLSPHCLYAKTSWDNFGLFHATDIHVSLRNQQMRDVLNQKGMTEAAQQYANCQECLRDFIHYANHLHDLGIADAVMMTGDLVDYVGEPGEKDYEGNFARLRRMILGQPFDSGVPAYEELRIPIFTTFGNHDYRLNRYDLNFYIDVDLFFYSKSIPMDEFSTFNITPDEAEAAQGGRITYGLSDFKKALAMLEYQAAGAAYFTKYFTAQRTFIVPLGANRLVMLDNGFDAGVPDIKDWRDLVGFLWDYATDGFSRATDRAMNGTIDAIGLSNTALTTPNGATSAAADKGVVIVGMHVPPFSPVNSEFPYYLRETVHPTADPALTQEYLDRNGFKKDGWTLNGTPYFKKGGQIADGQGLDNGVITQNQMEFLKLLAGSGYSSTRPVDLLLCGHHHERTEYRLRMEGNDLAFFMDFYMESPKTYYGTRATKDLTETGQKVEKGSQLAIKIEPGAPAAGKLSTALVRQHTDDGILSEVRGTMTLPPYPDTLDATSDPKTWWQNHRPIVAQTAALGPGDPRQRYDPFWQITLPAPLTQSFIVEAKKKPAPFGGNSSLANVKRIVSPQPNPTFNGFRFVQVEGNVIRKVRYITMTELRAANFKLPWEPAGKGPIKVVSTTALDEIKKNVFIKP